MNNCCWIGWGVALVLTNLAAGDKVRSHPRLKKEVPQGQRDKLTIGTLFVPKDLKRDPPPPPRLSGWSPLRVRHAA